MLGVKRKNAAEGIFFWVPNPAEGIFFRVQHRGNKGALERKAGESGWGAGEKRTRMAQNGRTEGGG